MIKSNSALLIAVLLLLSGHPLSAPQSTVESGRGAQSDAGGSDKAFVIVLGAVRLPARVEARRPVRLSELLALSGGVTERAGKTIRIYRSVAVSDVDRLLTDDEFKRSARFEAYKLADLMRRDEKSNPFLQTGDVVYVEEPGIVYIAGNVRSPQAMNLTEGLTLRQAISITGGLLPGVERIIIRRQGIGQEKETITVSRKDIESRGKDITLRPNDVVCVMGKMSVGMSCPFADLPVKPPVTLDKLRSRTLY